MWKLVILMVIMLLCYSTGQFNLIFVDLNRVATKNFMNVEFS
jgi:hypothetical protein